MRRLQREPTAEEAKLWEQEFLSGNDRAMVIVAAARMDALLGEILEKHLIPARLRSGEEDQLLSRMRPLSSFSARIYMARRLGLIAPELEDALHLMREIRNDMAHEPFSEASLDSARNLDKVKRLRGLFVEHDIVQFAFEKMGEEIKESPALQCRVILIIALHALTQLYKTVQTIDGSRAWTLKLKRRPST